MVVFSSHHTAAVAVTPVPRDPPARNTLRAAVVAQRALLLTQGLDAFTAQRWQSLKSRCIVCITKFDVDGVDQLLEGQADSQLLCNTIASELQNSKIRGILYNCMCCIGQRISDELFKSIFFKSVEKRNCPVVELFLQLSDKPFLDREVGPALNRAAFSGFKEGVSQLLERAGGHISQAWIAWAYRSAALSPARERVKQRILALIRGHVAHVGDTRDSWIDLEERQKDIRKYREEMIFLLRYCSLSAMNVVCLRVLEKDSLFPEKMGRLFLEPELFAKLYPDNQHKVTEIYGHSS